MKRDSEEEENFRSTIIGILNEMIEQDTIFQKRKTQRITKKNFWILRYDRKMENSVEVLGGKSQEISRI